MCSFYSPFTNEDTESWRVYKASKCWRQLWTQACYLPKCCSLQSLTWASHCLFEQLLFNCCLLSFLPSVSQNMVFPSSQPFHPTFALAQALALILNLSRLMEHTQCPKQPAEWFCVSVFLFPHKAWCNAGGKYSVNTWCGAMPSRTWRNAGYLSGHSQRWEALYLLTFSGPLPSFYRY